MNRFESATPPRILRAIALPVITGGRRLRRGGSCIAAEVHAVPDSIDADFAALADFQQAQGAADVG